ncbi:MAG: ABC transporter permease [Anaerolineae bacterium]
MQYARSMFKNLLNAIDGGDNGEEAWVDNDASLTPRERLVRRIASIMQWSAIVNALVLLILNLLLATNTISASQLGGWILSAWEGSGGEMALMGLLLIGANVSLALLLSASAGAQEFWTWAVLALILVSNVLALFTYRFYPAVLALIPAGVALFYMVQDWRAFHQNAVSVRELRGRMRGVRSFAIITVFLVLMGSFVILLYLLRLPQLRSSDVIITGNLGQLLFFGVVGVELMLIAFIVPALTAGAITGERERKTYDLLQTTLLSAPAFIVGKMESALGYIVLLLLSAIPLQSIAFLFGGVSQTEVYVTFILLMATALLLGALGMFFSATVDKTMSSTVRVYVAAVLIVFGLPLLTTVIFQGAFVSAVNQIGIDAASTFGEALRIYGDMLWGSLNPITSAYYTQQMITAHQSIFLLDVELQNNTFIPVVAPWIITTVAYLGGTALLLLLAIRRMRRTH